MQSSVVVVMNIFGVVCSHAPKTLHNVGIRKTLTVFVCCFNLLAHIYFGAK